MFEALTYFVSLEKLCILSFSNISVVVIEINQSITESVQELISLIPERCRGEDYHLYQHSHPVRTHYSASHQKYVAVCLSGSNDRREGFYALQKQY